MKDFAEWLVRFRAAKDFSQQGLADALSVATRSVTRWESGQKLPNRGTLERIAELAGEDPKAFVKAVRGGRVPSAGSTSGAEICVPFYARRSVAKWAQLAGMAPQEWVGRLIRRIEDAPPLVRSFVLEAVREGFEATFDAVSNEPTHPAGSNVPAPEKKANA